MYENDATLTSPHTSIWFIFLNGFLEHFLEVLNADTLVIERNNILES